MKFIVSSQVLLKQLQSIGGVLNSSNTLPILDNFLFEIQDQKLTISCSDLESTMTSTISIDAKSEGSIAIPAKMLLDILKTFPNHPLTFSIDDKMGVEISSDYGKYKLSGYSGVEFPKSPLIEAPSTVTISSHIFQRAIEKTIFASGNDDLRPVMSGIFVQLSESDLTFVATDAHKLVRYTRNDVKSSAAASFYPAPCGAGGVTRGYRPRVSSWPCADPPRAACASAPLQCRGTHWNARAAAVGETERGEGA